MAPLPRTKHPCIVVLCVLCARPDPNTVPRHDNKVIEALRRSRPRQQGIDDAAETKARKGGAAIPKGGGGRVKEGAEVEEDGEGEEERAQVGQAGWGAEELGEGARAVVEDVRAVEKRLERAAFYDMAAEGTRAATCNEALASSFGFGWTGLSCQPPKAVFAPFWKIRFKLRI